MPPPALLSLVAPPLCWHCGARAPPGEPLCRHCRSSLRWLPPEPVTVAPTGLVSPGVVEAWAPVAYDGAARALVGALKFHGALGVAEAMAAQIAAAAPSRLLEGGTLVPVPLHRSRLRRRGFNQAALLAAALARRARLTNADCLERRHGLGAQTARPRAARLGAIAGAIGVRPGWSVPARAVIVDDVITTGATLAACADSLRGAGARTAVALAYARTLGR